MVLGVWLLLPLAEHAVWSYSGAFDPRPCRLATIIIVTWPGEANRCSCRGKMLKHFADLTSGYSTWCHYLSIDPSQLPIAPMWKENLTQPIGVVKSSLQINGNYLRGMVFLGPPSYLNIRNPMYLNTHLNIRMELVFHTTSGALCSGPPSTYLNGVTEHE